MREHGPWSRTPNIDKWSLHGGFRTCSFCGSLHHEDWIKAVNKARYADGEMYISRGKKGKWYVRGKNDEGASVNGKFYAIHMPEELRGDAQINRELSMALDVSWRRTFPEEPSVVDQLADVARESADPG
jgi:hypothetical protein